MDERSDQHASSLLRAPVRTAGQHWHQLRATTGYAVSRETCYTGERWLRTRRDDPIHPSAADLGADLETGRKALMDAIAGLDEEGFRARPEASERSAAEVLAHRLATERSPHQQARAALAEEGCAATPDEQDQRQEQPRLTQRMAVPRLLHGLLAQRRGHRNLPGSEPL